MIRCGFLLLVLISCSLPLFSQFKNVRLIEDSDNPSVAINKRNPKNIVITSSEGNVMTTMDGGLTWDKQKVTCSFGMSGHPVVISDVKGTLFYFHLAGAGHEGSSNPRGPAAIICHSSEDGGKTWGEGIQVGLNPQKEQHQPNVDVNSKGELVVSWTQYDQYQSSSDNCQSIVMASTSSNGKKWNPPIQISGVNGKCMGDFATTLGASPVVSDDKKVIVAWSRNERIYLDRSYSNGQEWLSNDIDIAIPIRRQLTIAGHQDIKQLIDLKMDRSKLHKGLLYLVYPGVKNDADNVDVFIARSASFGDLWSSPMQIPEGNTKGHQYMPALAIDESNGNLYVLFYDRSHYDDNRTDVVLAYSTDQGNTFKTVTVSDSFFTPEESVAIGDYIGIVAHKGLIVPVWTRSDNGTKSIVTSVVNFEALPK